MTKKMQKNKYFLYARKSTESEDRQVLSIDSQIGELKKIASRDGLIIKEILSESRSAKDLGRPVFNEMIERVAKGEADGILCWKLDRLARNFIDGGKIIEMLQRGTLQHIRAFERSYYPQDNVLLMSVEFGMANQFSRDLAVNVSRGLRRKAEMGWYPVQPPLGYLNSIIKGKGSNDIFKDPERFPLVRKVFDLMLTGTITPPKILVIASDEWGLRTRKGEKLSKLSRSNIYYLLTNPFYYGMFEFPKGSGNWYKGAHEPMITAEEFDKVQNMLGRKGNARPKSHIFDFAGMMRCGECGGMITVEKKVKHQQNGNVHSYIYYHCTKRMSPGCSQGCLEEKELKRQIIEAIETLHFPTEFHQYGLKWFRSENDKNAETRQAILASQQSAYATCLKKLDNLIDMRAAGEITDKEYAEKKSSSLKEKAKLEELLGDTGLRANKALETAEDMFTFIRDAIVKFNTGNIQIRRQILSALGSNLIVKDKILSIDMDGLLFPVQKLSAEVRQIHKRLEPPKTAMIQADT